MKMPDIISYREMNAKNKQEFVSLLSFITSTLITSVTDAFVMAVQ